MTPFSGILVVLSLFVFCSGANTNLYNRNTNNLQWSDYAFSLREGNCRGTKLVDEEVYKEAAQYTTKKTTYTWVGRDMYYITCVNVHNMMPRTDKAGETRIVDGGVGQGDVKIEMVSKNSEKLHFRVEIWGEETRQQSANYAVMTNTPNKVLYMGGKKYCECQ